MLKLLVGFPSSSGMSAAAIDAYVEAVEEYSLEAVQMAYRKFQRLAVKDFNPNFAPPALKFAQVVSEQDAMVRESTARSLRYPSNVVSYPIGGKPPPGFVPLGAYDVSDDKGGVSKGALADLTDKIKRIEPKGDE